MTRDSETGELTLHWAKLVLFVFMGMVGGGGVDRLAFNTATANVGPNAREHQELVDIAAHNSKRIEKLEEQYGTLQKTLNDMNLQLQHMNDKLDEHMSRR